MQRTFFKTDGSDVFVPLTDAEGPAGRSVSKVVLSGRLDLPLLDDAMLCDWSGAYTSVEPGLVHNAGLQTVFGDIAGLAPVEAAVLEWAKSQALFNSISQAFVTPLVCQGSKFHTDGDSFSESGFLVVWLSEHQGLDLLFPNVDVRVPLHYGTLVLFDSGQPHGVVFENDVLWDPVRYRKEMDAPTQHFASFDFPLLVPKIIERLQITLHPQDGREWRDEILFRGLPLEVDDFNGFWHEKNAFSELLNKDTHGQYSSETL